MTVRDIQQLLEDICNNYPPFDDGKDKYEIVKRELNDFLLQEQDIDKMYWAPERVEGHNFNGLGRFANILNENLNNPPKYQWEKALVLKLNPGYKS